MDRTRFAVAAVLGALMSGAPALGGTADRSSVQSVPRPQLGGVPWTPEESYALQTACDALMQAPTLRGAHVGLLVQDTVRGKMLYTRNADDDFVPASNFKLLVGSAALARLGQNFRYTTSVASDAVPQSGVVEGNIYLRGGGDALLRSLDLQAAAGALAAAGITKVTGSLVTDASYFDADRYPAGWEWDDLPYSYAPVVSALELEDGVVHVRMRPGPRVGAPAELRVDPSTRAVHFDNRLVTGAPGSRDTSSIARPWQSPSVIELDGSYPLGAEESGDLSPSVPDPEAYAGDAFAQALAAANIALGGDLHSGTTPTGAVTLWTHASEPLSDLLADFWYPSDNLMGEEMLKALGVAQSGVPGSDAAGRFAETTYLQSIGVNPASVTIADGSGLSSYDRITPRALVAILQADWNGPNRDTVLDALPVAGVRGTLRRSFVGTAAERNVFAKTGSVNHVRTLSGYVITRSHGPVTFSFLINDWMGEASSQTSDLASVRSRVLSLLAAS